MITCSIIVVTSVSEESIVSFFRLQRRFRIMTQDYNLGVIKYSIWESMACGFDTHVDCVRVRTGGQLVINKNNLTEI